MSKRPGHKTAFANMALLLAGCGNLANTVKPPVPLKQISLYGGEVGVAGPNGYCIDKSSLQQSAEGSFVLLASCESLTGTRGQSVAPAVMTVSVLPLGDETVRPMAAELAGSQTPVEISESDDLSLVYLPTGGDQFVPGGDPKHWRAGLVINGYAIALAVYGQKGSAASGLDGKQLIMGLASSLKDKSTLSN